MGKKWYFNVHPSIIDIRPICDTNWMKIMGYSLEKASARLSFKNFVGGGLPNAGYHFSSLNPEETIIHKDCTDLVFTEQARLIDVATSLMILMPQHMLLRWEARALYWHYKNPNYLLEETKDFLQDMPSRIVRSWNDAFKVKAEYSKMPEFWTTRIVLKRYCKIKYDYCNDNSNLLLMIYALKYILKGGMDQVEDITANHDYCYISSIPEIAVKRYKRTLYEQADMKARWGYK